MRNPFEGPKPLEQQPSTENTDVPYINLPVLLSQIKQLNRDLDKKGTDKASNAEILRHIILEIDPSLYKNLTTKQTKQLNEVKILATQVLQSYSGKSSTLEESLERIGKIKLLEPKLEIIGSAQAPTEEEKKLEAWIDPWDRNEPKPDFNDPEAMSDYVEGLFEHLTKTNVDIGMFGDTPIPEALDKLTKIMTKELEIDPWSLKKRRPWDDGLFKVTSKHDNPLADEEYSEAMEHMGPQGELYGEITFSQKIIGEWKAFADGFGFKIKNFNKSNFIEAYKEFLTFASEHPINKENAYDVEFFDTNNFEVGKKLYEVEPIIDNEVLEQLLNDPDIYQMNRVLALFELEGVDGVIAAMNSRSDEYRSTFGEFKLIRGLKSDRIKEFGKIADTKIGESGNEGIITTDTGEIQFGTNRDDSYYPRGFVAYA